MLVRVRPGAPSCNLPPIAKKYRRGKRWVRNQPGVLELVFFNARGEQLFDELRSFLPVEMIGLERACGPLQQVAKLRQDIAGLARQRKPSAIK